MSLLVRRFGTKLWLAGLVSACLAACAPDRPRDACTLVYAGRVPLVAQGARLLLPTVVNGKALLLFLDTGGFPNLMSAPHAALLGLTAAPAPASGKPLTISGLGGERRVQVMWAQRVEVGDLRGAHIPFVVPDQSLVRVASGDADTLGASFLAGYDVDIDMRGGRIVIFKAGQSCARPHTTLQPPLYAAPEVMALRPDRPIVMATIAGQNFRALLDTGSPDSLLFEDAAARLGLDARALAAAPHTRLEGVGGQAEGARYASEPIGIGGLTLSHVPLFVTHRSEPGVDMVLGMNVLRTLHLWISNSSRTVVLQFPPQ